MRRWKPKLDDENYLWDISKWKDTFLLDPTKPEDQDKIPVKFNITAGWTKYVDGQKEEMEDTVCVKYLNLLYLDVRQ